VEREEEVQAMDGWISRSTVNLRERINLLEL
jgi:hypothetical protein